MKTILTVDCGTQSLRALLFDFDGNILCSKRVEYAPCVTPRAGWAEQDVGVYWNALKTAVAGLKNNAPFEFENIAGMGIACMRATKFGAARIKGTESCEESLNAIILRTGRVIDISHLTVSNASKVILNPDSKNKEN